MKERISQKEKAEILHQLHHKNKLIIFPNVWDVLGAKLMAEQGHAAVATASAAIAFTNGYEDGEKIPFEELLRILKRIAGSLNIPVTADIESGYADNDEGLKNNIRLLLETGIVGINIEDTRTTTNTLYAVEEQSARIRLIRKTAEDMNIPLFINARADVIMHGKDFPTPTEKLHELIRRGKAYKDAGANGFFPIALKNKEEIRELVMELQMPVNILTIPGIPDFNELQEIGVARVSLGPSLLKYAVKAIKDLSAELKDHRGLSLITGNDVTTDYLKSLINFES